MGKIGYAVKKWERKIGSIDELRKQAQKKQAHDKENSSSAVERG